MESIETAGQAMTLKHSSISLSGLVFVVVIHAGLLYFLFKQQLIPPPEQLATLMVNFIPSPQPKEEVKPETPPPPPKPKPKPVKKPQPQQLVANAPPLSESEPVAPPGERLTTTVASEPGETGATGVIGRGGDGGGAVA